MYRLFEKAQSVIFRYHAEAECYWRVYKNALDPAKVHIIPNGFEGKVDGVRAASEPADAKFFTRERFPIIDMIRLLQALVCLRESSPELANRLHLPFVGEGAEAVAKDAAALDVAHMITVQGPTSHDEVNKLTKQSHSF